MPISITADTLFPLGLVISIIGGVVWLTKVFMQGKDNATAISGVVMRVESLEKEFNFISNRLTRIETKLDLLIKQ